MFNTIEDATYGRAGEIIDAVHSGTPKGSPGLPGLSNMVAGAALAMERGAPNALYEAHASKAESYVSRGSNEWRMLHRAVARVIDVDARDPARFEDSGDVLRHIVADVSHQARHARLAGALDLPDLAPRVPVDMRDVLAKAAGRPELRAEITSRAMGAYHELSAADQAATANEMKTGSALAPALSQEVRRITLAMDKASDESLYWDNMRSNPGRAGEAADAFRAIPVEAVTKVDALLSKGVSTGDNALDIGIRAHAALDPKPNGMEAMSNVMGADTSDVAALMARARMVDDVDRGTFLGGPAEMARRIESDRLLMDAGQHDVTVHDRPGDRLRAVGAYHSMVAADRAIVQETLALERNVPALTALRLDMEVHEPRREAVTLSAQRQAAMAMQGMQR